MKKLFALAIVAGLAFASCGNKPAETEEPVAEEGTEMVQDEQPQQDVEETEAPAENPQ